MKIVLGVVLLFILLIVIYLNNTYGGFFDRIGERNLRPPTGETHFVLGAPDGSPETIVFLGDSLTAGVGATESHYLFGYHTVTLLDPRKLYDIYIYGHPGGKVSDMFAQVEHIKLIKPSRVIILIGINDLFNRTPTEMFQTDLEHIVQNLKTIPTSVTLLTIPYLATKDAAPFPFDFLYTMQLKRYNGVITSVAGKEDVQLIDLYSLSEQRLGQNKEYYASDDFHPNDKGYILLAELIAKELK